jgi:hypothetical protein
MILRTLLIITLPLIAIDITLAITLAAIIDFDIIIDID